MFVSNDTLVLAQISGNGPVTKNDKTIFGDGFSIRKPSTLMLKNVDDHYNGEYKFRAQANFKQDQSSVTVVVVSKYHIKGIPNGFPCRVACFLYTGRCEFFGERKKHEPKLFYP